jgi:hypothetical protein
MAHLYIKKKILAQPINQSDRDEHCSFSFSFSIQIWEKCYKDRAKTEKAV